jgi:hypothetical protein
LLGLVSDPEDEGEMFLRQLAFTRLHGIISQNPELFKDEDINNILG